MQSFLYFIIGLLVGYIIGGGMETEEEVKEIILKPKSKPKIKTDSRRKNTRNKEEKILNLLKKQEKISNDDVEKLLKVSDSTATRYLKRMTKEGLLKREGIKGRGVVYRKQS